MIPGPAVIGVGEGKTLITFLAGTVMEVERVAVIDDSRWMQLYIGVMDHLTPQDMRHFSPDERPWPVSPGVGQKHPGRLCASWFSGRSSWARSFPHLPAGQPASWRAES